MCSLFRVGSVAQPTDGNVLFFIIFYVTDCLKVERDLFFRLDGAKMV